MAARNSASSKTKSAVLEDTPDAPTEEEAPKAEAKQETTQQLKNRLRNDAEREVVNNHRDEFHALADAKFAEHGLEFKRRLTPQERAAKEVEKKLAQFPELRGQFSLNNNGEPVGEKIEDPAQDGDDIEFDGQSHDDYHNN